MINLKALSEKYNIGTQTLTDIIADLQRPGRDPRDDLQAPSFSSSVMEIDDLSVGMELQGVVRNITDFGAFVDIGLHNDGLVHKSQMANHFVAHPMDVVSLGQEVKVRVLEIDNVREKVSLSMKTLGQTSDAAPRRERQDSPARSFESPKPSVSAPTNNKDDDYVPESTLKGNITFS